MAREAQVLWTRVICRQPGRYIGWPTIVRRRSGELLVAFSGDRDEHICPWGKTQLVRSTDDGETWSAPFTVNDTPLDDRDPGIIEAPSGALVLSWFTSVAFVERLARCREMYGEATVAGWAERIAAVTPALKEEWLGNWVRRSEDGGRTWGAPVRTVGTAPHGPIALSDGRLLYVGRGSAAGEPALTVEESADEGRSWRVLATVELAPGESMAHYHEPHVAECPSGRLVALFRYQPPNEAEHYLRQAESVDGGRTWTRAHPTPLLGYPAHLTCLADGRLLAVYGRRIPPYGEMACLSADEGRTWDVAGELLLASAPNTDLGYPASAQLPDGSVLTVYYQVARPGEKTSLMATRWRP